MKEKIIQAVNDISKDEAKQLQEIVIFYKGKEITVEDMIDQEAAGLKISPSNIYSFAVKLSHGKDGLQQDKKLAFKLAEYAGQKGNAKAKLAAARSYLGRIKGLQDIEQDVDKAIQLLEEAMETEDKEICKSLLGEAYLKKGLLKEALEIFRQVKTDNKVVYEEAQKLIKQTLGQQLKNIYEGVIDEVPRFINLEQFCLDINRAYKALFEQFQANLMLEKIPECTFHDEEGYFTPNRIEEFYKEIIRIYKLLISQFPDKKTYYSKIIRLLTHEFSKANLNNEGLNIAKNENLSLNDNQTSTKPRWYLVSPILECYELPEASEMNAKMELELVKLESMIESMKAREKSVLVDSYLEKARMDGMPNEFCEELRRKAVDYEKQKNEKIKAAKESLNEAQKRYNSIINEAADKEFQRQIQTEKHFFSPHRTNKPVTREKALLIQKNRVVEKPEEVQALQVTDIPSRRMITAEISTIEASLSLYGRGDSDYATEYGWYVPSKEQSGDCSKHGNAEKIQLGATEISYRQRVSPHCNHTGDYYMADLGAYSNIISAINSITGTKGVLIKDANEQKLADYMLRFANSGKPISLEELKEMKLDVTDEDIHRMHRIFYHCFVKEPARWMLPKLSENELPFATAQIRAVELIARGYLSMKDVFAQYASYGVFTGTEIGKNIDEVKEKIKNINRMYTQFILTPYQEHASKHVSFFKAHSKSGQYVTTRKELHNELKKAYGGDSDTDDEGYDSDTANKLYSGAFKF